MSLEDHQDPNQKYQICSQGLLNLVCKIVNIIMMRFLWMDNNSNQFQKNIIIKMLDLIMIKIYLKVLKDLNKQLQWKRQSKRIS